MLGSILFLNEQMGELKNGMLVLLSFHMQYAIPEVCKVYHHIITHAPPNSTNVCTGLRCLLHIFTSSPPKDPRHLTRPRTQCLGFHRTQIYTFHIK